MRAVRDAAAAGMTQAQIAEQIGRSQPEVSRLVRFHGTTPLARRLRAARPEILRLVNDAGGEQVRIFGSVARGDDDEESDVDLLFVMRRPLSLMELGRLEADVSAAAGVAVDLVPESSLRPDVRDRVLAKLWPCEGSPVTRLASPDGLCFGSLAVPPRAARGPQNGPRNSVSVSIP